MKQRKVLHVKTWRRLKKSDGKSTVLSSLGVSTKLINALCHPGHKVNPNLNVSSKVLENSLLHEPAAHLGRAALRRGWLQIVGFAHRYHWGLRETRRQNYFLEACKKSKISRSSIFFTKVKAGDNREKNFCILVSRRPIARSSFMPRWPDDFEDYVYSGTFRFSSSPPYIFMQTKANFCALEEFTHLSTRRPEPISN